MLDLTREHDRETAERVARREHAVDAAEGIEARDPDVRLARQASDRFVDVAELKILREEQPVLFERTTDRETRLEPAQGEPPAQPRQQVARLDFPLVRPAPGANLHHARREPAVLSGERSGEHLDRLEALPG